MRCSVAAILSCCLLSTSLSLAAGVAPDKANKEQLEAAQRTFQTADGHYDAKRYEEAITAFRASYDIVASPNSRLMIARSMREAGRLTEAWAELEGTIADADAAAKADDKYESTAKAAREDLKKLESQVARVQFERSGFSSPVSVNGKPVPEALLAGPVALAPGKATVTAKRADGSEARVEVELKAGESRRVQLDLAAAAPAAPPTPPPKAPPPKPEPAPEPEASSGPGLRTWAFVAGGVGVVGLATFGVFGAMNNSKFSALEDDCEGGRCPSSSQDDIDAGKRYQTIANIGLAVGVVGLGTGAALFILGGDSGKKEGAKSAHFRPELRVGPGNLSFGGRFQ